MILAANSACGLQPARTPAGAADADLYVALDGDDTWSGTRSVPNRDRTDGPLRTVERARDTLRAQERTNPAVVMLRGGVYYLDAAITFDHRDPPTTYRAYPGETPELVGGRPITGWEPHTDDIWKASLPRGWVFRTLFENGVRGILARHPNEGYATVRKTYPEAWQTRFGFGAGDLPAGLNLRQLQVFIWPGGESGEWNWFSDILDIRALDEEGHTLDLAHPARYPIGRGSRYYVQDDLGLLDTPGEFFLNQDTSVLYYWPRQTPITNQEIIAATSPRVIACRGRTPDSPARELTFAGLTLRVSDSIRQAGTFTINDEGSTADDGLIFLTNTEGIHIQDCRITNTGLHAILMADHVRDCAVTGCRIADIGHTGVQINGPWTGVRMISTGNTISNNHIYDTGKVIGHGAGIQLVNSGGNRITHNRVHHTSRYAISLKSPRPGSILGLKINGSTVTRENAKNFAHSRDNEIAYNDLSHANLDSQDTGVFESWGGGYGNHLHHNRIHHSDINFSFGFGLYLDDAADGFRVTHNLLHDLQRNQGLRGMLGAAFMIKGVGNVLTDNVATDNQALAGIRTFEMADEPNRELVFTRNIVSNSGLTVYDFTNWSPERFAEADYNCFHLSRTPIQISTTAPGLAAWQKQGYDAHTLIADPGFVNPTTGDYRLRPDAAARALGIASIPVSEIGLTAGFPYADPADPLARLIVRDVERRGDPDAETLVNLALGETRTLDLVGRSATGFIVALRDARITFTSADPAVAAVSNRGLIQARAGGSTEITVRVKHGDVTLSTVFFVSVNERGAG
jgi:hypothetical protein